jgi:hypothetical protein
MPQYITGSGGFSAGVKDAISTFNDMRQLNIAENQSAISVERGKLDNEMLRMKTAEATREAKRKEQFVSEDQLKDFFDTFSNYGGRLHKRASDLGYIQEVNGIKGAKMGDIEKVIAMGTSLPKLSEGDMLALQMDISYNRKKVETALEAAKTPEEAQQLQASLKDLNQHESALADAAMRAKDIQKSLFKYFQPTSISSYLETGDPASLVANPQIGGVSFQQVGRTENGGFPIVMNRKTGQEAVLTPQGPQSYAENRDQFGRVLSSSLPQGTYDKEKELGDSKARIENSEQAMAEALNEGRIAPSQIKADAPRMGYNQNRVFEIADKLRMDATGKPINIAEEEARFKTRTSPQVIQAQVLKNSTMPLIDKLHTLADKLSPTVNVGGKSIRPLTELKRAIENSTGDLTTERFEVIKNKLVEETERLFTGVGAMADSRVKRNLDLIRRASTTDQIHAALNALTEVLEERERGINKALDKNLPKPKNSPGSPAQQKTILNFD